MKIKSSLTKQLFYGTVLMGLGILSIEKLHATIKQEEEKKEVHKKKILPSLPQKKHDKEHDKDAEKETKWQANLSKTEKGEGITSAHLDTKFSSFQNLIDDIMLLNKHNIAKEQKKYTKNIGIVQDMFKKYKERSKKDDFKFEPAEWSSLIGGLTAQSLSVIHNVIETLDKKIKKHSKTKNNPTFITQYAKLLKMQKEIKTAFHTESVEARAHLLHDFMKQYAVVHHFVK